MDYFILISLGKFSVFSFHADEMDFLLGPSEKWLVEQVIEEIVKYC